MKLSIYFWFGMVSLGRFNFKNYHCFMIERFKIKKIQNKIVKFGRTIKYHTGLPMIYNDTKQSN